MADINLRVVDLYHNDNVTSFADAASFGLWGVIHKASTGATGKDSEYANRRQPALDAGLLWGAYHWGTNADVGQQVDNFLSVAQPDAQTLVALDYEQTEGNQMTLDQARQLLTLIEEKLGRKAVLYSGSLIKEGLGDTKDAFFGGHRLWLAQYSVNPAVQTSWQTYWLWQYAEAASGIKPNQVDGIPGDSNGNLDCDSYSGTRDQISVEWAS
jgi:lysozyme